MEAEQLNRNLFLFKFYSRRDRQEVLDSDKSWYFEKQLVVLRLITGDEVLSQVELVETPVSIQMYDIPLNQRTMQIVEGIANKAGRFINFDKKAKIGWGKFVRARIALNVEKPLRRNLTIRQSLGQPSEVYYRYEGIPNFCYLCGRLGHSLKECERRSEELDEEEILSFGEWLRASPCNPFSTKMESLSKKTNSENHDSCDSSDQTASAQEVVRKLQMDKEP
ncbi:hypothetical protein Tsubulata_005886 [Turnera subulata]|uniref:CCHC-type domain-containing protein n=1 Tax=Turnera subulata TaxID=218843 RepID=A0A9Q0JHQ6_9ROSI|nr:hypothetical protein Tsubulata_005886 [Turnera subulata]